MAENARKALGWLVVLLGAVMITIAQGAERRPLPPVFATVNDEVGALSVFQGRELSQRIRVIESRTGAMILIVIVPTAQPETVEAYVQRLADHWQRERKLPAHQRFVFVVVAKADGILRIAPGRKLGWLLRPLDESGRMRAPTALLAEGRYYDAIAAIVDALAELLGGRDVVLLATDHRRDG